MKAVTINTRVDESGKIRANKTALKTALLSFAGKDISIVIKRKYKQRSVPQNRFYWGVLIPHFQECIKDAWGEVRGVEETHEILKAVCNYKEVVNEQTGEIIKVPTSTTELTTSGWLDYELRLRQFSLEFFNCTTPEPNEQLNFDM